MSGLQLTAPPPTAAAFVGVRSYMTAGTHNVATGGPFNMDFAGGDTFDSHGFHNPASNPHIFTVPTGQGGLYQMRPVFNADGATTRWTVYLRVAGADVAEWPIDQPSGMGITLATPGITLNVNAGQQVIVRLGHIDAGSLAISGGSAYSYFEMIRVGSNP